MCINLDNQTESSTEKGIVVFSFAVEVCGAQQAVLEQSGLEITSCFKAQDT